ncbi:MAG: hypothetical protein ABI824_10890 [Acidobacteriota bacterium]
MATLATSVALPNPSNRASAAWRPIIRAMGQTGGASLGSGLLSLLATKIIAVVLGPSHVGLVSTLQQLRQTALTGATLSGQTALVQGVSSTVGAPRRAYLRTVTALMVGASTAVVATMLLAPHATLAFAGLNQQNPAYVSLIRWLAIAVALSAIYVYLAALLNSLGAIGTLAFVQLAGPAAMAILAYPVARFVSGGSSTWFAVLLGGSAAVSVAAAWQALRRHRNLIHDWFSDDTDNNGSAQKRGYTTAAKQFFAISGAMFTGGLITHFALVTVRARILRGQGLDVGGQFDAAWAISMNQASLVLASLQTYYLPTLAAAKDRGARQTHISHTLTIASFAATALICTLIIAKPWVVRLLYSEQFRLTPGYLRWTLIGDYLKITSWLLSIPLIATANMRAFFSADLFAYVAFVVSAVLLNRWWPAADSASIAFVILYAAHLTFCATCLWRKREFRPDRRTIGTWAGGLTAILAVSAVCWRRV